MRIHRIHGWSRPRHTTQPVPPSLSLLLACSRSVGKWCNLKLMVWLPSLSKFKTMCFKGLVIRVITINLFSAEIWLEVYNIPILLASDNLITYFSNSMTQAQIKFHYMYHTLMLFVDVWMHFSHSICTGTSWMKSTCSVYNFKVCNQLNSSGLSMKHLSFFYC